MTTSVKQTSWWRIRWRDSTPFRFSWVCWIVTACFILLSNPHLLSQASWRGTAAASSVGLLIGAAAGWFGIPVAVAYLAWRVKKRSPYAATSAYCLTAVVLFTLASFGRARMAAVASAQPPRNSDSSSHTVGQQDTSNRQDRSSGADDVNTARNLFTEFGRTATPWNRQRVATILRARDCGAPWACLDWLKETIVDDDELKWSYVQWRGAEIAHGWNPSVSEAERVTIARLFVLRWVVDLHLAARGEPLRLTQVEDNQLVNPLTGLAGVAPIGLAGQGDGWAYNETTGEVRVVLPMDVTCRGLGSEDIERPSLAQR